MPVGGEGTRLRPLTSTIPTPAVTLVDRPFLLALEGVYSIEGLGPVVTGKIEQGTVKIGDRVEILGLGGGREGVVTGVEMFHRPCEVASVDGQAGS